MLETLLERVRGRKSTITLRDAFNEIAQIQDPNAKNLSETDINPYYAAFLCGVRMYGKDGEHYLYQTGECFMDALRQEFPHFGYPAEVKEPFFLFYRVGLRLSMDGELIELGNKKVRTIDVEDEIEKLKFSVSEQPAAVYAHKPIGSGLW